MTIPYEDQAKLFVQLFSRAAVDRSLQEVVSACYKTDLLGIAKILDYENKSAGISVADPFGAAYGMLAMVVGLSFFRVAGVALANGEDNRIVCEDYVRGLTRGQEPNR